MLRKNNKPLFELFRDDPDRHRLFCHRQGSWHLDYSRLPLEVSDRSDLLSLAARSDLAAAVERLFDGQIVNPTEQQPALHMALRATDPDEVPTSGENPLAQRQRFLDLAGRLHEGREGLTDLLHVGIGGSDLGPRLVSDALDADDGAVRVHWLSTLDGRRLDRLLRSLDPARTGMVIASKSFSTEETLTQAIAIRDWLGAGFANRAWAATANSGRALEFGLTEDGLLPFPSWTGGRFSLWSSVGVSAAARIGTERFAELLAGARQADRDFRHAPTESLATTTGLVMHFLRRELDLPTLGVVSYEPRLSLLADFLQQLLMESLGKGVGLDGEALEQPTVPLVFGGRGTDLQHSIFQALHQGHDTHPLLLVGTLADDASRGPWHQVQVAHLMAQATAFARGSDRGQSHQRLPGNRPVALLLTEKLGPAGLGYLLASFEHAVFALSVLWNLNPFDQWGVEEGKRLAAAFRPASGEPERSLDNWLALVARAMRQDQQ